MELFLSVLMWQISYSNKVRKTWEIPTYNKLQTVKGRFLVHNLDSEYAYYPFRTESGTTIQMQCVPLVNKISPCLDQNLYDDIVGINVSVKYFTIGDRHYRGSLYFQYIPMEIESKNIAYMNYSARKSYLEMHLN